MGPQEAFFIFNTGGITRYFHAESSGQIERVDSKVSDGRRSRSGVLE